MSQTNDGIFRTEFLNMMNGRRSMNVPILLKDLPLPRVELPQLGQPRGHYVYIEGVEEKFFDSLNKTVATLEGRKTLKKPIILSDGTVKRGQDGKPEYEDITVPNTHVALSSSKSIKLRRYVEVDGKKVEHLPSNGYKYVSFREKGGKRSYIYIVPKSCVYRLNVCALVLTSTPRRRFYEGYKIALQNGTYMYMYVLPFKYRQIEDILVLKIKPSISFIKEQETVLNILHQKNFIFSKGATELETQLNGVTNLGFIKLAPTIIDDFEAISTRLDVNVADTDLDSYTYDI